MFLPHALRPRANFFIIYAVPLLYYVICGLYKVRRDKINIMNKKIFVRVFVIFFLPIIFSCAKNQESFSVSFEAMNTVMSVKIYGKSEKDAKRILDDVKENVLRLENLFSVTETSSQVYKINHENYDEEKMFRISGETYELLTESIKMSKMSDGAFNFCLYPLSLLWGFTKNDFSKSDFIPPSDAQIKKILKNCDWQKVSIQKIPSSDFSKNKNSAAENFFITMQNGMMIDFGGIAKGYAGDTIISILKENDVQSALLDLGGNVQVLGKKPDGKNWKIGIKNPFETEKVAGILEVSDMAVITSAAYERFFTDNDGKIYHHILDGKTGYPAESGVISATAVTAFGTYGDSLSTALFVLGLEKSVEMWQKNKDFDFVIITDDGKIHVTPGALKVFSAAEGFEVSIISS